MGTYDWAKPGVKVRILQNLRNLTPYAAGDELYIHEGPEAPGMVYVGPDPDDWLDSSVVDVGSIEPV